MKNLLILVIALFALIATFAAADEDPTTTQFVKLTFNMRIPKGYDVTEWYKTLEKLSPACGQGIIADRLVKEVPGDRQFAVYQNLPEGTTLEQFETSCRAAIEENKDKLKTYGKVKLEETVPLEVVTLPSSCLTTCGAACPHCPLLNICIEDAQCGPFAKCSKSQKNPAEKWCLSSNATTLFATTALFLATAITFFF